jgi:hypothetical protein
VCLSSLVAGSLLGGSSHVRDKAGLPDVARESVHDVLQLLDIADSGHVSLVWNLAVREKSVQELVTADVTPDALVFLYCLRANRSHTKQRGQDIVIIITRFQSED